MGTEYLVTGRPDCKGWPCSMRGMQHEGQQVALLVLFTGDWQAGWPAQSHISSETVYAKVCRSLSLWFPRSCTEEWG